MRHKTITLLIVVLSFNALAIAKQRTSSDSIVPEVGKRCPEFTLNHVTHYAKNKVTLSEFSGKWLFLDFWFTGCITCIKSFPKINMLQQEFKEEVQFLMVGINDKHNKNIQNVFETLRIRQQLNIVSAYDSVLAKKWNIHAMPHIIMIDPQGIVRHITDGRDMTKDKLQRLFSGFDVDFYKKDVVLKEFNPDSKVASRDQLIYRSVLTKWNGERQQTGYNIDTFVKTPARENGFQLAAVHLLWLYNVAYFGRYYFKTLGDSLYGKVWQIPILEVNDSSLFEYSYKEDFGKGLYNYSLLLPIGRISQENIMQYMQQDLGRTFGFKVSIEERDMPVWRLVASPGAEDILKTAGGLPYNSASEQNIAGGFRVKNIPMKAFFSTLCFYLNTRKQYPFIDGTGFTNNVDVVIDADLTSISDVNRALNELGLCFTLATKRMKVLVIRD